MKVLFISNRYPPYEVGGYEQLCRDVAVRLEARGHQVAALTSDFRTDGRARKDEVGIYRRLKLRPDYDRILGPAIEFFFSRRRNRRHNLDELSQAMDAFQPEIVFIWNLQGLPRELALACEARSEVAVAYWLAGYTPAEPDEFWLYWQHEPSDRLARIVKEPVRRLALGLMRLEGLPARPRMIHTAVVSQYMLDAGVAEGTLPTHAQVIYNGVEVEKFYRTIKPRTKGPLRILQAGRVSRDKGVHTSLEAIGQLVSQGMGGQVELLIAGSGPADYERELQQFVNDSDIQGEVRFLGWLPRDEMPELMAECEVLLLPTPHPEPFARVVLEGMAAGLTVIGSRTGGTGELLEDGVNGLAFEAGDSGELARQLTL